MWYLLKGVTLTKDNLARRRWKGSVRCCFCNLDETIQHLFFDCLNAKFIWRLVQVVFNLPMPLNVNDIFTNWLNGVNKKLRYQAWVGACATLWAIWLSRNDVVFNKAQVYVVFNKAQVFSSLQVIFRATHWIRFWALLQKEEGRPPIMSGCLALEVAAMECFASN